MENKQQIIRTLFNDYENNATFTTNQFFNLIKFNNKKYEITSNQISLVLCRLEKQGFVVKHGFTDNGCKVIWRKIKNYSYEERKSISKKKSTSLPYSLLKIKTALDKYCYRKNKKIEKLEKELKERNQEVKDLTEQITDLKESIMKLKQRYS